MTNEKTSFDKRIEQVLTDGERTRLDRKTYVSILELLDEANQIINDQKDDLINLRRENERLRFNLGGCLAIIPKESYAYNMARGCLEIY